MNKVVFSVSSDELFEEFKEVLNKAGEPVPSYAEKGMLITMKAFLSNETLVKQVLLEKYIVFMNELITSD